MNSKNIIIVKDKDDHACSGRIDFSNGFFSISYSAWGSSMPDFKKLGWQNLISWHPTYTVGTKSLKIVRKTVEAGLNRVSPTAYKKLQ